MLKETNLYASQKIKNKISKSYRESLWKEVTKQELQNFFSIIMIMSLNQVPEIQFYWSDCKIFQNSLIPKIMPKDKRLFKVEPALTYFNEISQKYYNIGQEIVIDECLASYKGRIFFLQYSPFKQTKWGIKFWALADAHTGYIYKIKCYTGRQANADKIGKFGLGYDVACDLTSGMNNKGYHLYIDNYYTRFLC